MILIGPGKQGEVLGKVSSGVNTSVVFQLAKFHFDDPIGNMIETVVMTDDDYRLTPSFKLGENPAIKHPFENRILISPIRQKRKSARLPDRRLIMPDAFAGPAIDQSWTATRVSIVTFCSSCRRERYSRALPSGLQRAEQAGDRRVKIGEHSGKVQGQMLGNFLGNEEPISLFGAGPTFRRT